MQITNAKLKKDKHKIGVFSMGVITWLNVFLKEFMFH